MVADQLTWRVELLTGNSEGEYESRVEKPGQDRSPFRERMPRKPLSVESGKIVFSTQLYVLFPGLSLAFLQKTCFIGNIIHMPEYISIHLNEFYYHMIDTHTQTHTHKQTNTGATYL